MTTKLPLPAAVAALFAASLLPAGSEALAGPPRFHGQRPPMVHHASPHYRPHHWHHRGWHSGWYWGPLAAGITLYSVSELLDYSARRDAYRDYLAAQQAALSAQQSAATTVYWCEAEKGFYPQVRACPTGWTALPAGAVPP